MDGSLTDFDNLTFSHSLQMLKAALPYMNNSEQRTFTVFIKIFELRNALSLIQEEDNQLTACSENAEGSQILNMLNHIRDFCTDKEKEFIDLFINFNQAFQLFSSYRASMPEGQSDNNNMFDMLKNLLTPEQQAAFDGYSQMFAGMA